MWLLLRKRDKQKGNGGSAGHAGGPAAGPKRLQARVAMRAKDDQIGVDLLGGFGNYRSRVAARNFSRCREPLLLEGIQVSLKMIKGDLFGDVKIGSGCGWKHIAHCSFLAGECAQGGDDTQHI